MQYDTTGRSPGSQVLIQHVHGAASRVGSTETAFALREESSVVCIVTAWDTNEMRHPDPQIAWTNALWKELEPFASLGVYVNFLGNEGEERVRAAYSVNYERLVALKNTSDPTNFFALNQNIKPVTREEGPCFNEVERLRGGSAFEREHLAHASPVGREPSA